MCSNKRVEFTRKLVAARGWAVEDLDAEIAADTFKPKGGSNAA